jgi:hypothetical protein
MNEFMIHVERIVRPIQAMDDRKDRMREELLAHLEASFEQERAKQTDDGLARQRAMASLGDPVQLRNELQNSVSRMERLKAKNERLFNWHAPEPAWRYTLRAGVGVGLVFVLFLPLVVVLLCALEPQAIVVAMGLMALMAVLTGINVFINGLLYFKVRDNLLGAFGIKTSWIRIVGYVLVSAGVVEGSGLFFLLTTGGGIGRDWSLLLGRSLVALVVPLLGVVVAWFRGAVEVRHAEWECLDIRESSRTLAATE